MLLTITSTTEPARDLGHLLRKHPDRLQSFPLPFGIAHVFYPEASDERCTVALSIEFDQVGLVRGRSTATDGGGLVDAYVNDRSYVASSFLSVAIARVFGAALGGRSHDVAMAERRLALEVTLSPIRVRDSRLAERVFGPLGYDVRSAPVAIDSAERVGANDTVTIAGARTLQQMLAHIYVLTPVLDGEKHYWVGDEEVEKLFRFGGDWLAAHPEREFITKRYLKRAPRLARAAVLRLAARDASGESALEESPSSSGRELDLERPMRLQDRRIAAVVEKLRDAGARSIGDAGCGDGDLLAAVAREPAFERIVGTDVSVRELQRAKERLERTPMAQSQRDRIELFQSSVLYTDRRLAGLDAIVLAEVIEHVDPPRLDAVERVVFGFTHPRTVVVTTPNREYNARFPALPEGTYRHTDHRFEWTRAEFAVWANRVAERFGYTVTFDAVGDEDATLGSPTQMAVFACA